MGKKILSSIINLCIGISLLFIGIKNLLPDFIINKEEQIAIGFFLTVLGFTFLLLQILKIKNEKTLLYIGIVIGILLVTIGLFLMWKDYSFWAVVMATGIILFLPNLLGLLRRRFPDQVFFNKKPYNEEK